MNNGMHELKTIFVPQDVLAEKAGHSLSSLLGEFQGREILLLLAAGSAFEALPHVKPEALGSRLSVAMLDERFSRDRQVSNFLQFKTTPFYKLAVKEDVNIFDSSPGEGETADLLSLRFETMLREWIALNPKGAVISTFGVGEDGHIAGIAPFPEDAARFEELFEDRNRWVVSYDAGKKLQYPLRVTTTLSFLRQNLRAGVVYVSGERKRGALARLFSRTGSLSETPARILRELPNIALFMDSVV
jgi:6-phosphogluconolactonase/glucosamine-6-phosphate isomerase/deaminase